MAILFADATYSCMNIVASSFTQDKVKGRNIKMENPCDVMDILNTLQKSLAFLRPHITFLICLCSSSLLVTQNT
jgi:hypothetical protein